MATVITFTDEEGAVSLSAWAPAVGDRLCAFVPFKTPVGQRRTLLATGATRMYAYRTDRGAALEIRLLPLSVLDKVTRLVAHLLNGGTIALDTGDGTHTYATLGLAPGSEPELRLADPKLKRYTLAFRVIDLAASPTLPMVTY